jgi:DNA-binding transcriptional MocR family regulator
VGRRQVLERDGRQEGEADHHAEPPPPLAALAGGGLIITVGSLSKVFWGGLRAGWLRAPRHLVAQLAHRKAVADMASPVPSQLAAVRLLEDGARATLRRRAELRPRRDQLATLLGQHLPGWRWRLPAGGVCIWARLPRGNADDFDQLAHCHGVSLASGSHFGTDQEWAEYVRLPFTLDEATLETGVRRLARAWDEYVLKARPQSSYLGPVV